jgi:hypothetical protein
MYSISVSPLFGIVGLDAFADDTFIESKNINLQGLIVNMEKSLEAITKWLKKSGLKVNQIKTDLCLFHKNDITPTIMKEDRVTIKS